ncbi:MAG: hypothetical protein M5U08_03415 [Burkholderiales bacterium]|nr:hypothetical protein [Burkholderiales bacterium]
MLALERRGVAGVDAGDAVQAGEEIGEEVAATELAVGDGAEAGALLERDRLADGGVLGRPQIGGGALPLLGAAARLEQPRRAQQAADVVGAKRRRRHAGPGHGSSSRRATVRSDRTLSPRRDAA